VKGRWLAVAGLLAQSGEETHNQHVEKIPELHKSRQ